MTHKPAQSERRGILAGGNFIVDQVKQINCYPEQDQLALISSESFSNGGGPYNLLKDLAVIDPQLPLEALGLVGEDALGDWILADCRNSSVDVKQLQRTHDAATSYTDVMTVLANGRRTFFHQPGANALLDEHHFHLAESRARIFYLGYLSLLEHLDRLEPDGQTPAARLLAQARDRGMITVADMVSGQHEHFRQIAAAAAPQLDYLLLNEIEAGWLVGQALHFAARTDTDAIADAAAETLKLGVHRAVVIHYPEGALARTSQGEVYRTASLPLTDEQIRGAVGAGDAFAAGFLHGVHEGIPLERALFQGVCCAAACLSHLSASDGMRPLEECLRMHK